MGTITDKLNATLASKNAIRDAITEKIGEDAGEVMSTYAEKIKDIQTAPNSYKTIIKYDYSGSDPSSMFSYILDEGAVEKIRINSHRYVCKMIDGVLNAKQLQDNNGTLYIDGTTADLSGGEGDVFMKLPEFYYRIYSGPGNFQFTIEFVFGYLSPEALQTYNYKLWDGKDFIGVYKAYAKDEMLYSRSGVVSSGNISCDNFKTYARNRGNGYSLVKWRHHSIMSILFFCFYLNTNSQSIVGTGISGYKNITGSSNLLGMEDTNAATNGNVQIINFWGLEGWWGDKFEWIDNVTVNTQSGGYVYSWLVFEDDGKYTILPNSNTTSGYISYIYISDHGYIRIGDITASGTSGFCDYAVLTESSNMSMVRSYGHNTDKGGISSVNATDPSTYSNLEFGARLCYRGNYKIIN